MSLEPLLASPLVIQTHAFAAMAAFLIGLVQIVAPKGTLPHRTLGVIWVLLMIGIAVSSIFIRPALIPGLPLSQWFGPIHFFTLLTFWTVGSGLYHLAQGGKKLKRHGGQFIGIYIGGLVIAGAFAFLPGRVMHKVVFGG